MLQSFEKLTRMLLQERRLGYKNKAILGGLEKLAPNWEKEALDEASREEERRLIEEVVQKLYHYSDVAADERPDYIHKILVSLHKVGEKSASQQTKKQKTETRQTDSAPARAAAPKSTPGNKRQERPERQPEDRNQNRPQTGSPSFSPQTAVSSELATAGLESSVTRLPGIKDGIAKKLARLGVETIGDFLSLYPRRYDDYRALKPINRLKYGEEVTIIAQVWETRKRESRNRRAIVTAVLSDGTATIEATWFNQPWLVNRLKTGTQIVISGKVDQYLGRLTFQSPEWEELDRSLIHTGRIVPVYPLTKGIKAKQLRSLIKRAVDYWTNRLADPLPAESRERLDLLPLPEAVRQIHFPGDWDQLEAARRRLAFDELLLIQLGVFRQRQAWQAQEGQPVNISPEVVARLLEALPFQLTGAQRQALDDIIRDLGKEAPMSRLVQGDVGSGKTVVALAAMVLTVLDGGQTAILAPTEILAEQHLQGMTKLLEPIGQTLGREFDIRLLTGSTPAAERREILEQLTGGEIDILVGTHAIIQSDVEIQNLRLAVIDEQHRFGVQQRSALREKGFHPHLLVMTATPIPRTLALTLYGDLDLSIIDEMPPGRQRVATRWLTPRERERAYSFIQSQIEKGRQAFIVCPLVEESEKTEAKSAIEEHKRLQTEIFPRLKLGLLHGRMKGDEKDKVMMAFRDQKSDVLVSTSVVEVGIDIPNASVILIEGANRFGLAQLHQFRGRVGRGEHKSYCLLLADSVTPEAKNRLQTVERTTDGFELAEEDLRMRGTGEFFGTRQSGLPDLKLVKLTDAKLLELAREEARQIFEKDPALEDPRHQLLVRQLDNFWDTESDLS